MNNKRERRKKILDKMKRTNRMFDSDYEKLKKELELEDELEKQYESKKDELIKLLFEKKELQQKLDFLI